MNEHETISEGFHRMYTALTAPEEREKRAHLHARAKRIEEKKADTGAYA